MVSRVCDITVIIAGGVAGISGNSRTIADIVFSGHTVQYPLNSCSSCGLGFRFGQPLSIYNIDGFFKNRLYQARAVQIVIDAILVSTNKRCITGIGSLLEVSIQPGFSFTAV